MFKGMVLGQIESNLRNMNDDWVQLWFNDQTSILEKFIIPNTTMLKGNKNIALQTINSISVRELQDCCARAKPNFNQYWYEPNAENRIKSEIINIKNYISKL